MRYKEFKPFVEIIEQVMIVSNRLDSFTKLINKLDYYKDNQELNTELQNCSILQDKIKKDLIKIFSKIE